MNPSSHISNCSSRLAFPFELNNYEDDHDLNNSLVSSNYQASSSSSHLSFQVFFNSTTHHHQDQSGYYHHHPAYYQPQYQPEAGNIEASRGGSFDAEKKNKLKLTLWKREGNYGKDQVKGVNLKIKTASDHASMDSNNNTCIKLKLEDEKKQPSDGSSNSSSTSNIPVIRVCSDCKTTKTPLWRSGPNGPKSLCNACGIRQRKARRAMAAAKEALANGKALTTETKIIKVPQKKEKITKVSHTEDHVVRPYKKRFKFSTAASSSTSTSNPPKKLGFEDFLNNNLAIHRVFPQDEKEAAILLMALSSGLVHG